MIIPKWILIMLETLGLIMMTIFLLMAIDNYRGDSLGWCLDRVISLLVIFLLGLIIIGMAALLVFTIMV